jgi:hypothetical protein
MSQRKATEEDEEIDEIGPKKKNIRDYWKPQPKKTTIQNKVTIHPPTSQP